MMISSNPKLVLGVFIFAILTYVTWPDSFTVYVIRHGEKSRGAGLSNCGWRRAEYMAQYFAMRDKPSRIFAPPATDTKREIETVEPLAVLFSQSINTTFAWGDEIQLAETLQKARMGTNAIVCWEHCRLPRLLQALGCTLPQCMKCWPDSDYSTFIRFEFPGPRITILDEQFECPPQPDVHECAMLAKKNTTLQKAFQCDE
eukprot:GEMP01065640.1.p1 GENE.GEMP01065640.1~~GEMP01065640.1.p1  ORF type:complete len:201 (+),score=35.13 GEMP01065640.1:247-849(+)